VWTSFLHWFTTPYAVKIRAVGDPEFRASDRSRVAASRSPACRQVTARPSRADWLDGLRLRAEVNWVHAIWSIPAICHKNENWNDKNEKTGFYCLLLLISSSNLGVGAFCMPSSTRSEKGRLRCNIVSWWTFERLTVNFPSKNSEHNNTKVGCT